MKEEIIRKIQFIVVNQTVDVALTPWQLSSMLSGRLGNRSGLSFSLIVNLVRSKELNNLVLNLL